MKKKILGVIMTVILSLSISGCENNSMENISIITTAYPIKYVVDALYSDHATQIESIYPNGVNINTYKLNDKQLSDYSENDMFIYNGTSEEPVYAIDLLNLNKNIKIIDSAKGMEYTYGLEELWLDPFNYLMVVQNIKSGFKEYIDDPYIQEELDNKYDELNMNISELDVLYKELGENATNNTIIVQDDLWKFLEKYDINVISLNENSEISDKTLVDVKNMINNGTIEYVFLTDDEEENNTIKNLTDTYENLKVERLSSLSNLTDEEENEGLDYIYIMKSNIEKLRRELYK